MTALLPAVSDSRIPTDTLWVGIPTLLPVRDNAAYAWRNSSQECMDVLPPFLASDYRAVLEPHAIAAMEVTLPEVWREHGSVMLPCSPDFLGAWDRDVPDELFYKVWDEAARRIDAEALVATRLSDEYADYLARER